jgi:hypothetical protein
MMVDGLGGFAWRLVIAWCSVGLLVSLIAVITPQGLGPGTSFHAAQARPAAVGP